MAIGTSEGRALRLAFAANDPRAGFVLRQLAELTEAVFPVEFDQIDFVTKYGAAALSYRPARSEWWDAYQMHPLIQRRRRMVLQKSLGGYEGGVDALVMWGSWFHPFKNASVATIPYFNYIDQSHFLGAIPGQPLVSGRGRVESHRLQAETYRDSSGILCMSEWAREQTLTAHSISSAKVEVAGWGPCGADLSNEDIPESKRERLILHVSNDFRRKGVDFLLETARLVAEAEPTVRFVVVGEDSSGLEVHDTPTVRFVGPIRDAHVLAEYFRRASVFFLPHRFDRSPHVLVEAMSAALPFVASSQGGAVELAAEGRVGLCEEIGDVSGYARAILLLLRDSERRQRMGVNAKALMLARYNWSSVAHKIVDAVVRRFKGHDMKAAIL
jgi:glycosyltransferase involved in cell wall biosynthesis